MLDTVCHPIHHIECAEVWGGNRGNALDAETGANHIRNLKLLPKAEGPAQ